MVLFLLNEFRELAGCRCLADGDIYMSGDGDGDGPGGLSGGGRGLSNGDLKGSFVEFC